MKGRKTQRIATASSLVFLGAAGVLAACSGGGSGGTPGSGPPSSSGPGAALATATGVDWIVYTNPTDGTVVYASPKSGAVSLPAAASVDQAVLAFLASNKATFQMVDPASELGAATVSTADNGTVTVHFAQAQNGVPVYAADWSAHLDPSGKLTSMGGAYVPGLAAISTTPALAASAAATAAVAAVVPMEPGVPTASFTATAPSLEIFAVDVAPTLAWSTRVEVAGGDAYEVHVDASTGALIVAIDAHQTATASAPGAQSYAPYNQTGSTVSFVIGDGMPAPLDGTDNGYEIRTTALAAATTPITSPMASPWNDGTMPPGAAVSAQANAQIVLAFYAKHNGKDGKPFLSYDGAGSVLTSIINDNGSGGNGRDNAFWDTKSAMHYGDGIPGSLVWPQSSSLDTVAHEITHGVTQHTSMLSSAVQEAYAINESFSDTFAAFITHRIRGNDATDFIFSEDDNNAHVAVRSMVHPADPTLREGRGEQYYPSIVSHEQHRLSNLSSNAFYLLTHGGTNDVSHRMVSCGIGWGDAESLYWKLETAYMTSQETFKKLAGDSRSAAKELGIGLQPIGCAWWAVGVLEDADLKDWGVTCPQNDGGAGGGDASADAGNLLASMGPLVVCSGVSIVSDGGTSGGLLTSSDAGK